MSQRQDLQQQQQGLFRCQKCQRGFLTQRVALQHTLQCKVKNPVIQHPRKPPDPVENNDQMAPAEEQRIEQFYWGSEGQRNDK